MRRSRTLYASAHSPARSLSVPLNPDDAITHSVDWTGFLSQRGDLTISASEWESLNTGVVTISGAANADGVTSALFTAAHSGRCRVKNTITLSSGETESRYFDVEVTCE